MGYAIEGKLLEACSCEGLCSGWVGDHPSQGNSEALLAYHYDRGQINGVDVSGLSLALIRRVPGNILRGNWRVAIYIDSQATPEQKEAILATHTGRLGGSLSNLAPRTSEIIGVYDAPIEFCLEDGKGIIHIGDVVSVEMQTNIGACSRLTELLPCMFNTITGWSAYVGKAMLFKVNLPQHNLVWEFNGRNAILGSFRFEV